MSAYAEIIDGFCVNVVEAEPDFAEINGLLPIPEGYWIGDYYDGSTWHHEKPPTESQLLERRITDLHLEAIAQGQRSLIVNTSAVQPSARSEDPSRKVTAMPASVEATEIMSATGRLLSPMVISDPEILSLETMFIKGFSMFI